MTGDVRERKKALRKAIKARVNALSESYRAAASDAIQRQVLESDAYRTAESVFPYIAMPTEPDTRRIIERALSDGKRVYVPKCVSKTEMIAVRIRSADDLQPGAYGIPEPVDCSETAEPDRIDLILVPCVSASKDGKRLGHGAGYYDRFLAESNGKTICLCFREALCDEIPTEETDVRVGRVFFDEA